MEQAIEIIDLKKRFDFPLKPQGGIFQYLPTCLFPGGHEQDFWALRGVHLSVEKGKMLGIIGRNGSGKSTLLKVIAGILKPTSGMLRTRGRVTALLELGTGFQEELSGMENIFLSGAILGMSRKEIMERLPRIIEFSGLEGFLYTPIKHYSSGMQARLGFSIAANMDPDILLIDEVMSVGDLEFQSKCITRISEFKKNGKTIVLVTHEIEVANYLCDEIVWLEDGLVCMAGPAGQVAHAYRSVLHGGNGATVAERDATQIISTGGKPIVRNVRLLDGQGGEQTAFRAGEPMTVEITFDTEGRVLEHPGIRLTITRLDNLLITDITSEAANFIPSCLEGRGRILILFRPLLLLFAKYDISLTLYDRDAPNCLYDYHPRAVRFEVTTQRIHNPFIVTDHPCSWEISPER
ncbi:MAG: ABC transporter ATP-binding protein [Candidatus Sumerlaeota bacterium]|nr:ABC transporter ATP-binding protein [Candidatus Sumerlaeota bacterium]